MANRKQLAILKEGVRGWNEWREKYPETRINLYGASLRGADLSEAHLQYASLREADLRGTNLLKAQLWGAKLHGADLREANLSWADLSRADLKDASLRGAYLHVADLREADLSKSDLIEADLSDARLLWANLRGANLSGADLNGADLYEAGLHGADLDWAGLSEANLSGANLSGADFSGSSLYRAILIRASLNQANFSKADLGEANLSGADLRGANLSRANLIQTNFQGADLSDCRIYGISAWDVIIEGANQESLIITEVGKPMLTVGDMEVAQFIHLLLNNQKIKSVIDTITSKTVLILRRFIEERRKVLDSIRKELRQRGYVPILFDFEPSASRNLTETVTLLARMARFIIVDLTDPKSVPHELSSIIPDLPSVPVQPIILRSQKEYAMYEHWKEYHWVLEIHKYKGVNDLLADIPGKVISPAEKFLLNRKSNKQE